MKGSQEVVDFVADRLRDQRKNSQLNLTKICEEVNIHCQSSGLLHRLSLCFVRFCEEPKEHLFFFSRLLSITKLFRLAI